MSTRRLNGEELFNILMELLKSTTPYKSEDRIKKLIEKTTGQTPYVDDAGNLWYRNFREGDPQAYDENHKTEDKNQTLFCAHMDTVGTSVDATDAFYHNGQIFALSNKASCLGGDDKCGVLCLIALLLAGTTGTFVFHVGEEKGMIGASFIAKKFAMKQFVRAIEFDRRGTTSVITMMAGHVRTCSDEFAKALCSQLNAAGTGLEFRPDDTGICTDVFEYQQQIPEVTNLSVGFSSEHSNHEKIAADWLIKQFIPALYDVKWDDLPTARDPAKDNAARHTYYGNWGRSDYDEWDGGYYHHTSPKNGNTTKDAGKVTKSSTPEWWGDVDDTDIPDIGGTSVFDSSDFLGNCNFCGERDSSIKEYFFQGRNWALCDYCKQYLMFSEDDVKSLLSESEKKEEVKEKNGNVKTASSDNDPDVTVEVDRADFNDADDNTSNLFLG